MLKVLDESVMEVIHGGVIKAESDLPPTAENPQKPPIDWDNVKPQWQTSTGCIFLDILKNLFRQMFI